MLPGAIHIISPKTAFCGISFLSLKAAQKVLSERILLKNRRKWLILGVSRGKSFADSDK
jgi:hypothetical protein